MGTFTIYPAIDLRGGQVVRLTHGDPEKQTTYHPNPSDMVNRWKSAGFDWLHIVNLDAAFGENDSKNNKALEAICAEAQENRMKTQLGGGIRGIETIRVFLESGFSRVILGTAAVENPTLVDEAIRLFGPEKIVIGVDAKDGLVRIRGWQSKSDISATDLVDRLKKQGVSTIIFTDISRDGTKTGVNIQLTAELARQSGLEIIASGGIHIYQDVCAVKQAGIPGVVIGKALYDESIDLESLIRLQRGAEPC